MKQIYLLKLSQDQNASIFLTQMLLNILNILGQSNALEKLICMVVISWSLVMSLQMWPPNISHCPGFHIWTILWHWTNQSLFLLVKTEVRSIVLPHWPSIYILQHNKEPSTCRTRGCRLAHGTRSPPCCGACCQQNVPAPWDIHCHPSARGCAQDSDSASDSGGGCVLCLWPCCRVVTGKLHGHSSHSLCCGSDPEYFNQKAWKPSEASLSTVL